VIDKIEQELQTTPQTSMEEQCSHYSTNHSFCTCGRTTRISGLHRFDIICSHRRYKIELALKEESVQLPKFELPIRQYYYETSEMSVDTNCQHKKKSGPPIQETEKEKQYENLSELTIVFENMLNVIMKITKLTNRNQISKLLYYDFY
jgi:rRNA maturation protein Nop10